MFSFCFSLRSTVTGELALCCLTLYSSYSIWTTDTQAIQEVPIKLHKTPINTVHNMESLVVMKCSNFNIWASWRLKHSFSEKQVWWHHTWSMHVTIFHAGKHKRYFYNSSQLTVTVTSFDTKSQRECAWPGCRLKDGHAQCTGNTSRGTGTVRGTARRSHFSLTIVSVTVQLRI